MAVFAVDDISVKAEGVVLWRCSLEIFELFVVRRHGGVVPPRVAELLPVVEIGARGISHLHEIYST